MTPNGFIPYGERQFTLCMRPLAVRLHDRTVENTSSYPSVLTSPSPRLPSYFQPSRCLQCHPGPRLISEGIRDFRSNPRQAILAWLAVEVERDDPGSIASESSGTKHCGDTLEIASSRKRAWWDCGINIAEDRPWRGGRMKMGLHHDP